MIFDEHKTLLDFEILEKTTKNEDISLLVLISPSIKCATSEGNETDYIQIPVDVSNDVE